MIDMTPEKPVIDGRSSVDERAFNGPMADARDVENCLTLFLGQKPE